MLKQIFFSILLVSLGVFFIFSGAAKLFPIEPFEYNFVEQGFLNWQMASVASRLIIAFEMFLGFMLIFHQQVQIVLKMVLGLLSFFTLYLVYAIIKDGNNGNCGCFGTYLQMTPLESIIKNISLVAVSYLLLQQKIKGQFKNKWMLLLMVVLSGSIPLVFNPPDILVVSTYDFGKLDYPLKAEELSEFQTKNIDANWKEGKKVIAFLSTTCPHCRNMAFKLQVLKKQHPEFVVYFVFSGTPETKKTFIAKTRSENIPNIDLPMHQATKIVGPSFPVVMGIENGIVKKKWNLVTLTQAELSDFFKK